MAESAQVCTAEFDGALVGTAQLLRESPNVTKAPATFNQHVPSIYVDGRGEIHNILAGNKRINVLYTKAGVMRSGDIHANTQHDFVFEGSVEVWFLETNGTTIKQKYGAYQYICVPPYTPHVFHFLQDSVMSEWWEPEPFEAYFYTPYRQVVEQSFTGPTKAGKLLKLVASDDHGGKNSSLFVTTAVGGITLALGLFVGIMVGRRKST